MEGKDPSSHRTQGGSHGQSNPPPPPAVDSEATSGSGRGRSRPKHPRAPAEPTPEETVHPRTTPPLGPKGRPEPTPAQATRGPVPRARLHRLPTPGPGPDTPHLSPPHPPGLGRHPHRGRAHHHQPAPHPGRLGPGPPQQLSPRPLPPPLVYPAAGPAVHRRHLGSICPPRPRRGGR